MKRRGWCYVWVAFQLLCIVGLIVAAVYLDEERGLGLASVFEQHVSPVEAIGAVVALLFIAGIWWLLSGETYAFRIGDRVASPLGPGVVSRREYDHGQSVYGVQYDDGTPICFMAEELSLLPRAEKKQRRPWYRPGRMSS